jgi:Peptidase A4 family
MATGQKIAAALAEHLVRGKRVQSNEASRGGTYMSSEPAAAPTDWEFDEQDFLRKIPFPVTPTNLKGAYAGIAPPEAFDPNMASASELIKNGILWRRPAAVDDPILQEAWRKVFSRKWLAKDRIIPVLASQIGRTHNLRKPPRKASDGSFLTSGWAGAATSFGGPFTGVLGYWNVPTVTAASEPPSGPGTYDFKNGIGWDSASWVGIDGYGTVSTDVLQVGVEQYVDRVTGNPFYVAFYEWFVPPPATTPAYIYQTNITNLPVSPGDEIAAFVQYMGKTAGYVYVANLTTGQHFSMTLSPPKTASFLGNTVEWIMEDPDGGEDSDTALAQFSPVEFHTSCACTASGAINNPQYDDTLNIETVSGQTLTNVTVGNLKVTINFIG